jgi:hypothetical protein
MSKRSQYQNNKRQKPHAARPPLVRPPLEIREAKVAKVYGKPFVLLEDASRATFQFLRGAWVPYPKNIAECRQDCEVKQLSQKVNNMTRYEVRAPIAV